jgi:type II secretory pathway pseudopilin PulG
MNTPRRGLTLTELLVVLGLMVGVMGLVLAAGRDGGPKQANKFMQSLSAALVATQTRALNSEAGAALILETGTGAACQSVFVAAVPPYATGSVISGIPPTSLAATSAPIQLAPTNASPAELESGYAIRFSSNSAGLAPSPWFQFLPGASVSGTAAFDTAANQTVANTAWPILPQGGPLFFTVARRPTLMGPAFDPIPRAGVDLRYSGIGDDLTVPYGRLSGSGSVSLIFDRAGTLAAIASGTATPIIPSAPLYLLVASILDIENNQALSSDTARWLAIVPSTGRGSIGRNVPISLPQTGVPDRQAMEQSRANARLGITGDIR